MKQQLTKLDCLAEYAKICTQLKVPTINRDIWRLHSNITEYQINKLFGSFKSFNDSHKGKEDIEANKQQQDKSFKLNVEKYSYNPNTKQYRIYCPSTGGNVILNKELVESLKEAYSNFDKNPCSINEICKSYHIPRKIFLEIKTAMGWTHDSLPVTTEQILENDDNSSIINDLIQRRTFTIEQQYNKECWKQIEDKAKKFDILLNGIWNPLKDFLSNWQPPKNVHNITCKPNKKITGKHEALVINLSDIHFGKHNDGRKSLNLPAWTIHDTMDVVQQYAEKLNILLQSAHNVSEIYLLAVGDIIDSLTGLTEKGTRLDSTPIGEEQFSLAMDSMVLFIDSILKLTTKLGITVNVKSVSGNHSAFGDWALFYCLSKYYHSNPAIKFDISEKRWNGFKLFNSLIVFEHGYSPYYKHAKLPSGPARQLYIQDIMNSPAFSKLFASTDYHYYIVGDQHHLEHQEYTNFEFIMLSSITPGNNYEDHNLWLSRQRQTILLFDDDGLKQQIYFYFNLDKEK